ncbi:ribosome biogenesis factor YjgA [Caldimonas sp. KR1-144]|uniref:ribosome biogenesis factor YjgA n=1 Tax=Caldimonas sp. KR1-144 TaxID=3400911 RepID=UPI003BFD4F31
MSRLSRAQQAAHDEPLDDEASPAAERPSKTQLKQQMHELQSLGEALLTLPAARVAALALPEPLQDALDEARRTKSFEGKRRQMQLIGKLMRQVDPQPVREAVAAFRLGHAQDALALHEAERWRAELIAGDDALTRWMAAHPSTDAQQLRSLVRAARKDAVPNAAPGVGQRQGRAFRELFQLLREALARAGDQGADHE